MRTGFWAFWGVLLLASCGLGGCSDDDVHPTYEGQFVGSWGNADLLDGQLAWPTCVALDPASGNIYVGDLTPQSQPLIHVFSPEGEFIERWTLSYSVGSIKDMVVASDGTAYATDKFGRILHLSSNGAMLEAWGAEGGLTGTAKPFADDIALGEDGLLYVAYSASHFVRVLDREGNVVRTWGLSTPFYPQAIALDSSGFVYVAEHNRIHKFKNDGEPVRSWDSPASLYRSDLAVMEDGDLLLIQERTAIHRFTSDGALVASWDGEGSVLGGLAPDIEMGNGEIYTLGLRDFGVQTYDEGGGLLRILGDLPSGVPGQFYFPTEAVVTAERLLVVRDGFRMQFFSTDGLFQYEWPLVSVPDCFEYSMTSLPDGSIAVGSDSGARRYSPTGELLGEWSWGVRPFILGDLESDETGRIWVTDTFRDRVIAFSPEGQLLDSWGISGDAPGNLRHPRAVAAREGYVAICDLNGIQVFDQEGKFFSHLGKISSCRVAIAGGKLYVSNYLGNVWVFSLAQARLGFGASAIGEITHHGSETRPFVLRDVAATPEGDVYVLSPVLGKVFQYRFGEAPPSSPTAPGAPGD